MSLSCEIPSEYCPHGVCKMVFCDKCAVQHRLNMLETKVSELEIIINSIKESYNNLCAPSLRKEPFKCRVCNGKRLDLNNPILGSGGLKWHNCSVCEGTGIIWG